MAQVMSVTLSEEVVAVVRSIHDPARGGKPWASIQFTSGAFEWNIWEATPETGKSLREMADAIDLIHQLRS